MAIDDALGGIGDPVIEVTDKFDVEQFYTDCGTEFDSHIDLKLRPDIKAIFEMDDKEFEKWYVPREAQTHTMLTRMQLFGSIPECKWPDLRNKMGNHPEIEKLTELYEKGLKYLRAIKKHRRIYRANR